MCAEMLPIIRVERFESRTADRITLSCSHGHTTLTIRVIRSGLPLPLRLTSYDIYRMVVAHDTLYCSRGCVRALYSDQRSPAPNTLLIQGGLFMRNASLNQTSRNSASGCSSQDPDCS